MSDSLSLEAFAKLQIPALRHDAALFEGWRENQLPIGVVRDIGIRLLRVHTTITEQDWVEYPQAVRDGLRDLQTAIDENHFPQRYARLVEVLVRVTRAMLGDDPGPEPHGGPLANQMAIGVKKK